MCRLDETVYMYESPHPVRVGMVVLTHVSTRRDFSVVRLLEGVITRGNCVYDVTPAVPLRWDAAAVVSAEIRLWMLHHCRITPCDVDLADG